MNIYTTVLIKALKRWKTCLCAQIDAGVCAGHCAQCMKQHAAEIILPFGYITVYLDLIPPVSS